MTLAWTKVVEDAIYDWVVAGSQLPAEKVLWAQQNGPRPEVPFIEMRCASITPTGMDWVDATPAEIPAPGADAVMRVRGSRVAQLSLQCYGDATGDQSALTILERVRVAHRLPSVREALALARVGVGDSSPAQFLGGPINILNFEPRAFTEIQLHLSSELTELGPAIQTVQLTNNVTE